MGISLKAYGNDVQNVKLYTQNAPQYEGDCEYRISSLRKVNGALAPASLVLLGQVLAS